MTAWLVQSLLSIALITHLLDRVTFGPRPADAEHVQAVGIERYIDEQLHPERLSDAGAEARLALIVESDKPVVDLAQQKVIRAVYSNRQLQEVLVDFWFNHFNVD